MLDERAAAEFVDQLELDDVHGCPLCLLELAWVTGKSGEPSTGLLQRTAGLVWPEIEVAR